MIRTLERADNGFESCETSVLSLTKRRKPLIL